ncbi:transposase-like zinc-binding domain-containing protein [Hymenobacter tenuis]
MITTHHVCSRCASLQIRKNGSSGGRAKHQCTSCGHQGYF